MWQYVLDHPLEVLSEDFGIPTTFVRVFSERRKYLNFENRES
jgi:hypothetical protein